MATGTKKLQIIITASAAKAHKVFTKLKSSMRSIASAGAKIGVGLAAGFAVAGAALATLTIKVLNLGDDLAKTADKLGVTTEELSAMRHAGQLAGIEISAMDKSLQFMQRNIAEAADGTAAQADAFKALGLSIESIKTKSPADAMQEIVGALGGIENQAKKVQVAMDIFGRSGTDMLNLTAEGFSQARKEAELFGVTINRADAKKMENINDSLTRIKSQLLGASITLVKQFVPSLEAMGAKFVEWGASGALLKWAKDLGKFLVEVIPQGINFILTGISKLLMVMGGWKLLLQEIHIQWLNILILIQKVIVGVARFAGSDTLAAQRKAQGFMEQDRDKAIQQQMKMIAGQKQEQTEIEQIKKNVDGFVKSIEEGTNSVVTQTKEVNGLAAAYDRAAVSARKMNLSSRSVNGERVDLNSLTTAERTEGAQ